MSAAAERTESDDDTIRVYAARWKLAGLALPCFLVGLSGLYELIQTGFVRAAFVDGLLVVIGVGSGMVMAAMALDKKPVLTLDARGITCRRPPTGLIPWGAVAGLGLGKVSILRRVLLIAVDEPTAGPELSAKLKNHRASTMLNPAVARFQGQMQKGITIQVPISLLDIKVEELQRLLEERVHYHGG